MYGTEWKTMTANYVQLSRKKKYVDRGHIGVKEVSRSRSYWP